MRVAQSAAFLSTVLSVPALVNAISLDCSHIRDNGVSWNLKQLGGPRSVHHLEAMSTGKTKNLTFTIDICKPLRSSAKGCPTGARICAFETIYNKDEKPGDEDPIDEWAVAGNFEVGGDGRSLNAHVTRLKNSDSIGDADKEGVRISVEGGTHGTGAAMKKTKAVIELICDPDKTGNEKPSGGERVKRQDDDDDDVPDPDKGQSLRFVSYKDKTEKNEEMEVLSLEWKTKYACEKEDKKKGDDDDKNDDDDGDSNGHWGFFTWFIIVLFLAVATYLIFGSWLNYNRYGARGWDLLPHGDTIRDVPYLLKEWGRRVLTGGGSRDLGYIRV